MPTTRTMTAIMRSWASSANGAGGTAVAFAPPLRTQMLRPRRRGGSDRGPTWWRWCLGAALMAPAIAHPRAVPAWMVVLAAAGVAVVYLTQMHLLALYRQASLPRTWQGGASAALAAAAALVTVLRQPLTQDGAVTGEDAVVVLCLLGCSTVCSAVALASVRMVGRGVDARISVLAVLLPTLTAVQVLMALYTAGVLPQHDLPLSLLLSGLGLLGCAGASVVWVASSRGRGAEPRRLGLASQMSGTAAATLIAAGLLVGGVVNPLPEAATALAVTALLVAACRVVVLVHAVGAARASQRQAHRDACTDSVTGAGNRRSAEAYLRRLLGTEGAGATVVLMDLTHFQHVNDALGYPGGDELLRQVHARLIASARLYVPVPLSSPVIAQAGPFTSGRFAASGAATGPARGQGACTSQVEENARGVVQVTRYGNDEFAVISPGVDEQVGTALVGVVQQALHEAFTVAGQPIHVSAAVGVATAAPPGLPVLERTPHSPIDQLRDAAEVAGFVAARAGEPGADMGDGASDGASNGVSDDRAHSSEGASGDADGLEGACSRLVARADGAMRTAQRTGAAVVVAPMLTKTVGQPRLVLAEELRTALAQEQLELHYQPQVCVSTGRVRGVEALIRWRHPQRGLVPPVQFLPLVAEYGLQADVTAWVIDTAVHDAARWRTDGFDVPVSVNLSPQDVAPGLATGVAALLMAAGLPARNLVLEITETSVVEDPRGAGEVLQALVQLGVRVSIDDYGTGFSSLALLLALPVSELKIDRSFVAGLGRDERSEVVVATTIDLAHRLGMEVVAEGVETEDVLAHLGVLGCDISQGYLHSRPMQVQELLAQFRRREVADAPVGGILGSG